MLVVAGVAAGNGEEIDASTTHCRNCGFALWVPPRKYCAQCGQATRLAVPSVREFAHEFVDHYVALDGRLFNTLKSLLFRPGQLSREYFAGRRQQYIGPLKLYLTFSLIFFVAFKLAVAPEPSAAKQSQPTAVTAPSVPPAAASAEIDAKWAAFDTALARSVREYGAYAMMMLMPIFAIFTRVLYPRHALNFGSHLVFALHFHAALFLLLSLAMLLPAKLWSVGVVVSIVAIYLFFALQTMFSGHRMLTLVRTPALFLLYSLVLIFAVLLVASRFHHF